MSRRVVGFILFDLLFIVIGFWISVMLKHSSFISYIENYSDAFILFGVIWLIISLLFNKYKLDAKKHIDNTRQIILSNVSILAVSTILIYFLRDDKYSRFIVMGTIGFTTIIEISFFYFWVMLKKTKVLSDDFFQPRARKAKSRTIEQPYRISEPKQVDSKREISIKKEIVFELGRTAYCYFEKAVNLFSETTLILSTTTKFNVSNQRDDYYSSIVNFKRVNDIRRINKFFEAVNEKLPKGGLFICLAETKELRKKRILAKFPPVLNYIYYTLDYFLKRVFPKFPITKNIYFLLTRGENRVISRAELLGRLYSCGFEVVEEEYIDNLFFVIARKFKHPEFDLEPTYGPIIKLKRIGKGGKIIKVYKMRTMHPYAEYLQSYIFDKHNLQEGGKIRNDFRVSTVGRFMRKFWIDELPMLINLFRGDLKLVGVRPLSKHYFNLYTQELQEKRVKFKPGLIPPFYVDYPKTLEEIMDSEMKYLDAYEKHPFNTDVKYFFKAVYNIIFKRYRSS
ncbi:MAG: sugar transferase [Bacteroidales bacterium]|nr:MAG: sugar transferase [Bacteroidales bacterium]